MKHPTAAELHEAVRNPNPSPPDSYEGGFSLKHPDSRLQGHIGVVSRWGDIDVSVVASAGRASSTAVAGLSVDEARELGLALERAAGAAENYEMREST